MSSKILFGGMLFNTALLLALLIDSATAACNCPTYSLSSHKRLHSRSSMVFSEAKTSGLKYRRPLGGSKMYAADRINRPTAECESQQIHVGLGDSLNSVVVSYVSNTFNAEVYYSSNKESVLNMDTSSKFLLHSIGTSRAHSELYYIIRNLVDPSMGEPISTEEAIRVLEDTSNWAFDEDTGEHWFNWYNVTEMFYGFGQYNNPYMYYQSLLLHTVHLENLDSDQTYYYRVGESCTVFEFKMPRYYFSTGSASKDSSAQANLYPFSLGLTGDVGTTEVSAMSIAALAALEADAVLLVGDLSYSDGYLDSWDSFGRMVEPLASMVPLVTTGGNHEVQSGENWVPYNLRYPSPHMGSLSPDPAYYGRELGPVHLIALNSYSDFSNTSIQYRWLQTYLSTRVNRDRTPWVIVMVHVSLYHSNVIHWKEGELMRRSIEQLLYSWGVDIVLSGHLHAYERTAPMYNFDIDNCGMTHLILGDGGNYEGEASPWRVETDTGGAPLWSMFRESSFGVGNIVFHNASHASYSWHRHACGSDSDADYHMNFSSSCVSPGDNSQQAMETSDTSWIIRPAASECSNRYAGSAYQPSDTSNDKNNEDDSDDSIFTKRSLVIFVISLSACCVALLGVVVYMHLQMKKVIARSEEGAFIDYDYKAMQGEGEHFA